MNRELLDQRFPPGSTLRNAGNVTLDNPDRVVPHSDQVSAGYEHQIASTMSASADYVHVWGRGMFMTFDKNKGSRATTVSTAPIVRPDPNFQAVNTFINVGETEYDALLLQLERRLSRGFSARVSYTFSHARGNTSSNGSGAINFQTGQDMNLDLNEGPSDFDRRHNLVISGRMLVPYTHGMTFSWVARALSGLPFTLTNNTIDVDRNGTLFDPIAAGSYVGAGTIADDNYAVDFDGGRNAARGPGFFQFDTRFGWRLPMGNGRTLDLSADVFNLTNRANFANPSGNQSAPSTFLVLSALRDGAAPRTLQIGARLGF